MALPGMGQSSDEHLPSPSNVGGVLPLQTFIYIYTGFCYAVPRPGNIHRDITVLLFIPFPLWLILPTKMVPIFPSGPFGTTMSPICSKLCIPHRIRDGLAIHCGQIHLIRNGVDLAASACRSSFLFEVVQGDVNAAAN